MCCKATPDNPQEQSLHWACTSPAVCFPKDHESTEHLTSAAASVLAQKNNTYVLEFPENTLEITLTNSKSLKATSSVRT